MDTATATNTVEVTAKSGEKTRISERKYLAAMRNLAAAHRRQHGRPISQRKRAAILQNLAKAWSAPRTRSSYVRARHNATKHGLFVRHLAGSFLRLGEDPRRFRRLSAVCERAFAPRDVIEIRLVKRLAEVIWRHLRTYHAAAVWTEQRLHRKLRRLFPPVVAAPPRPGPPPSEDEVEADLDRAGEIMEALVFCPRLHDRQSVTLHEVNRTLRLLLIHRSGNPRFNFRITGRRFRNEIGDLSVDPRNWPRRYAGNVPLK